MALQEEMGLKDPPELKDLLGLKAKMANRLKWDLQMEGSNTLGGGAVHVLMVQTWSTLE